LSNNHWQHGVDALNLAVDVACWYLEIRKRNTYADQDDITTIMRCMNDGLNGLEDRKRLLLVRAKFFLGL